VYLGRKENWLELQRENPIVAILYGQNGIIITGE
jgi:hypothetical protein